MEAEEGIPNNTTTWSDLMEGLTKTADDLGKVKNAKQLSKELLSLREKISKKMEAVIQENAEVVAQLNAENEEWKKIHEKAETDQNSDSISILDSDDESTTSEKRKRRSSVMDTNLNLLSVAKKFKPNPDSVDDGQIFNQNFTRIAEKETLSSKLIKYNDFIPTTPMSDASLRRIVNLLESFQFPEMQCRSSYQLPIYKIGDDILSHLELVKVFLTQNFRDEKTAYLYVFMSLSEVPHLKSWANSELMTQQPVWKKTIKLVIDRVIDKNSAKEAVTNLLKLEWGAAEKPENFITRYVRDLTNANQTENGWTFLTETLYKAMDFNHRHVRRSLQNALALANNDQRNLEHIKEMFLEISSSFKEQQNL